MVEYHGWATIRAGYAPTPACLAEEERLDHEAIQLISSRIVELHHEHYILQLKVMNGAAHLYASGFSNHRSQDIADILDLFRYIAEIAPGSYGLLYIHDDEDQYYHNEFRVWRLAKGSLTEHGDPFLSPYFPAVEEPEA